MDWSTVRVSQRSFAEFSQFRLINAPSDVWGAVWIAVISELWKHRNNVIFNRGVADVSEVFALVQ